MLGLAFELPWYLVPECCPSLLYTAMSCCCVVTPYVNCAHLEALTLKSVVDEHEVDASRRRPGEGGPQHGPVHVAATADPPGMGSRAHRKLLAHTLPQQIHAQSSTTWPSSPGELAYTTSQLHALCSCPITITFLPPRRPHTTPPSLLRWSLANPLYFGRSTNTCAWFQQPNSFFMRFCCDL